MTPREVVTRAIEFRRPPRLPVCGYGEVSDRIGVGYEQIKPPEARHDETLDQWLCRWEKTDQPNMGQVKEDVTVMAQILTNQLHEQDLVSWGWPSAHNIETVAINGYGVVFILKVDFPLMEQTDSQTKVQAESGDSVWDSTRQQLHQPHVITTHDPKPSRPYDADKVEKLKEVLCSSLRHASNIRSLQGQQWVVMAVNAEQGDVTMNMYGGRGMMRNFSMTNVSGGQKSTMVIKAKKADIDRFADQQFELKDFQGMVQINTFARP